MPCSSLIINQMLPEIHKMENCDFLNLQFILKLFNSIIGGSSAVSQYFLVDKNAYM